MSQQSQRRPGGISRGSRAPRSGPAGDRAATTGGGRRTRAASSRPEASRPATAPTASATGVARRSGRKVAAPLHSGRSLLPQSALARQVPILGLVENMSFFDIQAYLSDRGSPKAKEASASGQLFGQGGDERVYLFGKGGVRRKAEAMGIPFLGEVPLNIHLRENGDEGRLRDSLAVGSTSSAYLLGVVEKLAQQISIQNIKTPKMPKLEILN